MLPPLVPDADVLPILPSAVVVSAPAPAVLELLAVVDLDVMVEVRGAVVALNIVGAGVVLEVAACSIVS